MATGDGAKDRQCADSQQNPMQFLNQAECTFRLFRRFIKKPTMEKERFCNK